MSVNGDADTLAIVGLGVVTGPQPGRTRRALAAEAARLAIADAGLERSDIDGAVGMINSGGAGAPPLFSDPFPRVLALPVNFYFEVGRGGALGSLAIATARSFIERGVSKYVCVSYGTEGYSRSQALRASGHKGKSRINREGYWGEAVGDLQAVSHHSWMASRHMEVYGTTSEQLGSVAVQTRAWAAANPEAKMYQKPITLEDHQASPFVVEPYHLLDMSQNSDGGVALVITTLERARDLQRTPVTILGQGFSEATSSLWWENKQFEALPVAAARDQAFSQASITLEDIDTAQLYDCFTGEVIFQLEGYGWCGEGDGGEFAASGAIGPGGTIPVNTGGGLLSCWHMNDLTGLSEGVRQLRGEATGIQLDDCNIAISTGHGGEMLSPGMCSIHTCTVMGKA